MASEAERQRAWLDAAEAVRVAAEELRIAQEQFDKAEKNKARTDQELFGTSVD